MVNVLIADDNIDYAIYLMNYINKKNEHIKDCEVEKLKKYFSFSIDTKPKVKTVINTIINKIL